MIDKSVLGSIGKERAMNSFTFPMLCDMTIYSFFRVVKGKSHQFTITVTDNLENGILLCVQYFTSSGTISKDLHITYREHSEAIYERLLSRSIEQEATERDVNIMLDQLLED